MTNFNSLESLLTWVIDHRFDHNKLIKLSDNYDDWDEDDWKFYREVSKDVSNPITLIEHHDIKKLNMEKAMDLSDAIAQHHTLQELYEDLLPEDFTLRNGIINIAHAIDELGV